MKKTKVLVSTILVLGAFLLLPSFSPPAHAATGTVCLVDSNTTSCPRIPASLIGNVGVQLRVSVFLQGTDHINGFDVTTLADHTILSPDGIDLTGSILPAPPSILVECLGGILVHGNTCQPTDNLDTIHLAATGTPGQLSTATTGLLFTAIYNITTASSGIPLGFQTGCNNTSVSPNVCVTIVNGGIAALPETVQTATFSTSTAPDFAMTGNPSSITLQAGSSATSTLSITSVNSFSGTVSLTATIFPSGPGLSLSPTSVTLASGQTMTATLTISTSTSTPPGTYTATVNGTSGALAHFATVTVTVNAPPPPDFTITANPVSLTIQAGSSGTSTITLTSINGFTGTVSLISAITPSGPTTSLSTNSVTLSSGGTATTLLTVSTTSSTAAGSYTAQVTGTSTSTSHATQLSVTVNGPPQPDFTISANPSSLSIPSGSSATSTITIAAVNGFSGVVSLSLAPSSGMTATISPTSITTSGTATLTVSVSTPGSHTVRVTGTSGAVSHNVTVLVNVPFVGEVCVIPSGATTCPSSVLSFSSTAGSQLRVSVFIQGSDALNGFDITLLANHAIFQPADASLTGTVLPGTPAVVVKCIGGILVQGSTCSPTTDTIDTIHFAAVGGPGMITNPPTTGLLFTAIYNVVASTSSTVINFQTGCSGVTSVSGVCVTIANGTGSPDPETVPGALSPSFTISASPTTLTIQHGSQGTSTITLTSVGGFAGTISLTNSISPSGHHSPTTTLSASSVTLSSGGTGSVVLTISTSKHVSPGTYTITINATSGSLSTSVTITLTIN